MHPHDPHPPQTYTQPVIIASPPASGLAVASLVLGIFGILGGWCLCGIPCILAVILGHMATPATRRGDRSGHGMAIAGLTMGYIFVIPAVIGTALLVFGGGLSLLDTPPTP